MAVELVVFDIAGTTVHDGGGSHRCFQQALAAGGLDVSRAAVERVMGLPKDVAICRLLDIPVLALSAAAEAWMQNIYDDFARRMVAFYASDPEVREIEPARDVFRELRQRNVKVALDTGLNRAVVDVILERLGWDDLVDATVAGDEVPRGRPHPDLVWKAMERTLVAAPTHVGKVGDTPADLAEGTAAGCRLVVGVTEGLHTRQQLEAHPHTHLVGNLGEVPPLVWTAGRDA